MPRPVLAGQPGTLHMLAGVMPGYRRLTEPVAEMTALARNSLTVGMSWATEMPMAPMIRPESSVRNSVMGVLFSKRTPRFRASRVRMAFCCLPSYFRWMRMRPGKAWPRKVQSPWGFMSMPHFSQSWAISKDRRTNTF